MSIQAIAWALKQDVRPTAAKLILVCAANYADDKGVCWPSKGTLARDCSIDKSGVCRHLLTLQEMGFLTIKERTQDGVSLSSLITLNLDKETSIGSRASATGGGASATGGDGASATGVVAPVRQGVVAPVRHKPSLRTVNEPKKSPKPPLGADDDQPSNVIAVSNWNNVFQSTDAGPHVGVIRNPDQSITLVNGTRTRWLDEFDGDEKRLELALIEIAGQVNDGSKKPLTAYVQSRLARIASEKRDRDRRYRDAAKSKAPPSSAKAYMNRF